MKILFTGGGSGGHFYPIAAIIEEIRRIAKEERFIQPKLFFMAPESHDPKFLFDNEVEFIPVDTGKRRIYSSASNFFDIFKTFFAIVKASFILFKIYPDIIFGKGGYGSFPALFASRLLGIPVFIHESDSVPGRVNKWAGKFAKRIAVSFPEAAKYFPADKTAYTGHPIRRAILESTSPESAFGNGRPLVLVLGGSLGSEIINRTITAILPELLNTFAVVHQTGQANFEDIKARTSVILQGNPDAQNYLPLDFISSNDLASFGKSSSVVVTRAGSTLFEISAWGKPSVVIPITESNGNHQRTNAFIYGRTGAAIVIEEANLFPAILLNAIRDASGKRAPQMSEAAIKFGKTDSAEVIAREIFSIALKHEN